jgi:hypothetical protein
MMRPKDSLLLASPQALRANDARICTREINMEVEPRPEENEFDARLLDLKRAEPTLEVEDDAGDALSEQLATLFTDRQKLRADLDVLLGKHILTTRELTQLKKRIRGIYDRQNLEPYRVLRSRRSELSRAIKQLEKEIATLRFKLHKNYLEIQATNQLLEVTYAKSKRLKAQCH